MKLCLVTPFADPEKGAAIVRVNSFKKFFESNGHAVVVLAPARNQLQSTSLVTRYSGLFSLFQTLFTTDFDALIATSPPITDAFFSLLACKLKQKPFVLDSKDLFTLNMTKLGLLREKSPKFWVYRFMEIISHQHANKVLVLDNRIGDWMKKNYSLKPQKVLLAANGVDPELVHADLAAGKSVRKSLQIPSDSTVLVYLGGLGDERYIEFLAQTAPLLKKHTVFVLFIIASDGSAIAQKHLAEIESTVHELKLQNQFRLLQNIEHAQVFRFLSAADIGLDFWGDLEFFPITVKILEYLACGLPVLVKAPPRNKNFEQFFSDYDVGFAAADWPAFCAGFKNALENKEAFKKKGARGESIIKKQFTREITNKKVLKLLQELNAGRDADD